jgi:hypothetical protein
MNHTGQRDVGNARGIKLVRKGRVLKDPSVLNRIFGAIVDQVGDHPRKIEKIFLIFLKLHI